MLERVLLEIFMTDRNTEYLALALRHYTLPHRADPLLRGLAVNAIRSLVAEVETLKAKLENRAVPEWVSSLEREAMPQYRVAFHARSGHTPGGTEVFRFGTNEPNEGTNLQLKAFEMLKQIYPHTTLDSWLIDEPVLEDYFGIYSGFTKETPPTF